MELSWEPPASAHHHSPRKASAKDSHKNECQAIDSVLAESQVTPQEEEFVRRFKGTRAWAALW